MAKLRENVPRRQFLKTAGAGMALLGPKDAVAEHTEMHRVPTLPFGKTGLKVPILSLASGLYRSLTTKQDSPWTTVDFSKAERQCPHQLPIAGLISEAAESLA